MRRPRLSCSPPPHRQSSALFSIKSKSVRSISVVVVGYTFILLLFIISRDKKLDLCSPYVFTFVDRFGLGASAIGLPCHYTEPSSQVYPQPPAIHRHRKRIWSHISINECLEFVTTWTCLEQLYDIFRSNKSG